MSLVLTPPPVKNYPNSGTEVIRSLDSRQLASLIDELCQGSQDKLSPNIRAALDPNGTLSKFCRFNPDLKTWFVNFFPYLRREDFEVKQTAIGLILEIDGGAYAEFVKKEGIRIKDSDPISLGVTLRLDRLPQELHNLFIAVNRGNRSAISAQQEIRDTTNHELLHLIFNKFFCTAPFISSFELGQKLSKIDRGDLRQYKKIAQELAHGMIELSRSEVISYFGTGYYDVQVPHLCANFWRKHSKEIVKHLEHGSACDRQRICRFFLDACHQYVKETRAFIKFARDLIDKDKNITQPDLIAALLIKPSAVPHQNLAEESFRQEDLRLAA
jgi:hypothetical protein